MYQRDSQRKSLTPARRERTRQCIVMTREADQIQSSLDTSFISDPIHAAIECQVFQHGQIIINRELLRHISGTRAHVFTLPERIESQNSRFTVTWLEQAQQHSNRCC